MNKDKKTIEDAWNEVEEMELDKKFQDAINKNKDLKAAWNKFVTNFFDTEELFRDLFENPVEPGNFIRDIREKTGTQALIITSSDDITCVKEA